MWFERDKSDERGKTEMTEIPEETFEMETL